jgi:hypothetical protein
MFFRKTFSMRGDRKMKKLYMILSSLTLIFFLMFDSIGQAGAAGNVLYAAPTALGFGNCSNWANTCTLQTAIANATSGNEIWVVSGTYRPTTTADRTLTFTLKNGVAIYGGFNGTETLRTQRNWVTNVTILSGDIGVAGTATDNSYHVVTGGGTNSTAVLDGFTITAGYASGTDPNNYGGGMYNLSSSPSLANLTFSANLAVVGGGMYNKTTSNPSLTNVTFNGNTTTVAGGGMCNNASNPSLTNVTFSDNTSGGSGGGMFSAISNPRLTNVIFSNNLAVHGGGMYNTNASYPILTNVTFSGNQAMSNGGGMYNDTSDPSLTDTAFGSNSASNGGGIFNTSSNPILTNVTFTTNTAASKGGGMYNIAASNPSLMNVTFSSGNFATVSGGGMYNDGSSPTLTSVAFSSNSSPYGGGMYNTNSSGSSLTNVTFDANAAGNGAGMYNNLSNPSLMNVTFSGNTAAGEGGGGMTNQSSHPTLTNVTFNANTGTQGGGVYNIFSNPIVKNSLFWGNSSGFQNSTSIPTINDSLIQGGCPMSATCNANIIDADPLLGALANNGGTTQTMAPGAGSPAIDAGNDATCATSDQRGIPRPQDGNGDGTAICDMGSFEVQPTFTSLCTGAQDGWVLESTEASNLGGSMNSTFTTFRLGDDAAKKQYRGILSFSTGATLPDDAVITSVTLKVKRQGITGGGNPVTLFQGFMVDIKKGFFGTAALQASDFQAKAHKSYGPFVPAPSGGWYSIDLTSGKAYINKLNTLSGLTQIRLRFQLDDNNNTIANYLSLFSGNAPDGSRPQLVIQYYVP